jgi:hypothetical protein
VAAFLSESQVLSQVMSTKLLVALKWSSANTEKSTWDAQLTYNIIKNQYAAHPNISYSLPSQHYDPISRSLAQK